MEKNERGVEGVTLDELIDRLTAPEVGTSDISSTLFSIQTLLPKNNALVTGTDLLLEFLLTYRSICEPQTLIELIWNRFRRDDAGSATLSNVQVPQPLLQCEVTSP